MTPRRMAQEDYERERQRIRAIYGDSNAEAGAQRDQALAALFYRSGWTQEQLAKAEHMSRPNMTKRLTFGRFLGFVQDMNIPRNLSFSRFFCSHSIPHYFKSGTFLH